MSVINVLPAYVADLIAAGEVVERPASVVKELMENAVDAGARTVVAEIRSGGREFIRVTDDGCGMAPEDAGICFLRHATSKLKDARGLEAIGTLGFRGEALAAISAVSRITLLTRQRGADSGTRIEVVAGEIESAEETGCPEGTTIIVRDLFFNTPARLKFMGSDRAESSACVLAALRCALGRPDLSFRCVKDGAEQFFSPGDGELSSAVYALLGREFSSGLKNVFTEDDGVSVAGFVSAPGFCRGNRSGQYFFCNGRPIRSKTLQAALEQAYKNTLMTGKFPACVLYVTLSAGLVDVNVHPTKAEVKFAREKAVFDGVYYGVLSALSPGPTKPEETAEAEEPQAAAYSTSAPAAVSAFRDGFFPPAQAKDVVRAPSHRASFCSAAHHIPPDPAPFAPHRPAAEFREPSVSYQPAPMVSEEKNSDFVSSSAYRLVGEIMETYVLLEQEGSLLVIDKHAAHERILFDKMRLDDKPLMSQALLIPETVTTDGEGLDILSANENLLARLGYAWEPFGESSIVLRSVPADVPLSSAAILLEELIEKLKECRRLSVSDIRERLAATVACKAAIKSGSSSDPRELAALAEKVLSGEIQTCPHGRPVMAVISRKELDKHFGRIV